MFILIVGAGRVGSAIAKRALDAGDPSYRTIRGILVAGLEDEKDEEPQSPPSAPAHLHGPERLFDVEVAQ